MSTEEGGGGGEGTPIKKKERKKKKNIAVQSRFRFRGSAGRSPCQDRTELHFRSRGPQCPFLNGSRETAKHGASFRQKCPSQSSKQTFILHENKKEKTTIVSPFFIVSCKNNAILLVVEKGRKKEEEEAKREAFWPKICPVMPLFRWMFH